MTSAEEVVVEICPECKYARCKKVFGNAWFRPFYINPKVARRDQLCPHCDKHLPLMRRREIAGI